MASQGATIALIITGAVMVVGLLTALCGVVITELWKHRRRQQESLLSALEV